MVHCGRKPTVQRGVQTKNIRNFDVALSLLSLEVIILGGWRMKQFICKTMQPKCFKKCTSRQCNSGWLVTVYVILISQIPSKTGPHHKNTFLICYPYSVIYIVWFTSKCLRVGSFNESFIAPSRSNTKIWLFFLLLTEHDECFPWFVLVPAQKKMYWFICNPPKKINNNIKHLN